MQHGAELHPTSYGPQARGNSQTSLGKGGHFWPCNSITSSKRAGHETSSPPIYEHPEFRLAPEYFEKLSSFRCVPTRQESGQSRPEGLNARRSERGRIERGSLPWSKTTYFLSQTIHLDQAL